MFKEKILSYFGNGTKTAKALGVSKSTVSQWNDVIPWEYALLIEKVTEGELLFDHSLYPQSIGLLIKRT